MFTRRAATRVAYRASRHLKVPLRISFYIAFACRKYRLRYALGYALVQQESNFQHIFGHDYRGHFPGEKVTRRRYRELRDYLSRTGGKGANGVGLTQITYHVYILEQPGLWKKRANVYFGLDLVASYVKSLGEREGFAHYNGGPSPPSESWSYAEQVLIKAKKIRQSLNKEDK